MRIVRMAGFVTIILVFQSGLLDAQSEELERAEELTQLGRTEEARTVLLDWWNEPHATALVRVEENFRREPNGVVLGRLQPGVSLDVVRREGSWWEVDLQGWIWLSSLQERDSGLVVTVSDGENLRDDPSGSILGRFEEGALLEELSREPDWVHVTRREWIWSSSVDQISSGPSRGDLEHGLWLRGRLAIDPVQAELDFQRLIVLYPNGPFAPQAIYRLAQLAFERGEGDSALRHVQALVRDYPTAPRRREAEDWLAAAGPPPSGDGR